MTAEDCKRRLQALRCCTILPTYNNEGTLARVVDEVGDWCADVIVVNDGSTDGTSRILQELESKEKSYNLTVIEYPDGKNRGKGYALKTALRKAGDMQFRYAMTMDSDGQHYASDMPVFVEAIEENEGAMIIGARNLSADGMPGKNTFANKFSNFWFKVETLQTLSDTQSGYRLYPLETMRGMRFVTPRYEFEVESIVRMAWRDVKVMNVPINVIYPEDRVSHFRPLHDFARISVLNTVLVICALLYFYPKCFARWVDKTLIHSTESASRLACSVGLGAMIGTMPIWGFQTVVALATAHLLKLNKIIVVAFSNVSLPPLIPFILYYSMKIGGLILGKNDAIDMSALTLESVKDTFVQYAVGAVPFAIGTGLVLGVVSFLIIRLFRK